MPLQHHVMISDDQQMPPGQDWLLIEHADGVLVVLRRSACNAGDGALAEVLAQAWAAFRWIDADDRRPRAALRAS